MNKLILVTLCLITLSATAQESKSAIASGETKEQITCQHLTFNDKSNTATLVENVKITSDRLYLEADSVVYDMKDRSFVAYQYKALKFNGEVVIHERPKNIIRYKLKSDKLYID